MNAQTQAEIVASLAVTSEMVVRLMPSQKELFNLIGTGKVDPTIGLLFAILGRQVEENLKTVERIRIEESSAEMKEAMDKIRNILERSKQP